jgi:hypothetical protein
VAREYGTKGEGGIMLDLANNHLDDMNRLTKLAATDIKYKYLNFDSYAMIEYTPLKDTWKGIHYVSINGSGEVTGYIKVSIERPYPRAQIVIMNTKGLVFMADLLTLVEKLFNESLFPKLTFSVLIGNPAEKIYDRFIANHGGRVVGIYKKHETNLIGEICDLKLYEILKEDFK